MRKSTGEIVQFEYGSDNWDACHLVRVTLVDLHSDFATVHKKHFSHTWKSYKDSTSSAIAMSVWKRACQEERQNVQGIHEILRSHKRSLLNKFGSTYEEHYMSPLNLEEEFYSLEQTGKHVRHVEASDLSVSQLRDMLTETLDEVTKTNPSFKYYLMCNFTCKNVIVNRRWSLRMLQDMLQIVKTRCRIAKVHANEMVGSVGAESFGEPCTQMTLNTLAFLFVLL